ncbi:hypothetical protein BIY27_11410 [Gibbsiella quercinecans]|uniref:hypothetical protein n=1 Tax=Gibbsiella quercinecans TaxID=929813 RepID=UPI000EF1D697|nr:hypothetical protein [Gibbsiella quercinecans]RLM12564.1 hypothetical protein BIY27_11410 [Gibbsiella quercinecans]
MGIVLKDETMILSTVDTVDTVISPVPDYNALFLAGNSDYDDEFRMRLYGDLVGQLTLNGPWKIDNPGFKADGSAVAYFDLDVTQNVPRTALITGIFNKGAKIFGFGFDGTEAGKSLTVERGSGVTGSGYPSFRFVPGYEGKVFQAQERGIDMPSEPDGCLTLFISGDDTGAKFGVIYGGKMVTNKTYAYPLSKTTGRTRVGGSSLQPDGNQTSQRVLAGASFPRLLTDDELLTMGNYLNDYAADMGAVMYE